MRLALPLRLMLAVAPTAAGPVAGDPLSMRPPRPAEEEGSP